MSETGLCIGKAPLFDSSDARDHLRAKALCDVCPALDWCRTQLEKAKSRAYSSEGPMGTWAGQYIGKRSEPTRGRMHVAVCGTPSGYKAHLRKRETTCPACRAAVQAARR